MKIPELKKVWSEAMCTKLKNISQGWDKNRGTNTVRFLTHKEIAMIQKDRIVTYTRVVVDYRSQKDDPNRFQLVVGRNKLKATRRHLIPKYDTSFQKTRRSHTPTFSAASDLINQRPNESVWQPEATASTTQMIPSPQPSPSPMLIFTSILPSQMLNAEPATWPSTSRTNISDLLCSTKSSSASTTQWYLKKSWTITNSSSKTM